MNKDKIIEALNENRLNKMTSKKADKSYEFTTDPLPLFKEPSEGKEKQKLILFMSKDDKVYGEERGLIMYNGNKLPSDYDIETKTNPCYHIKTLTPLEYESLISAVSEAYKIGNSQITNYAILHLYLLWNLDFDLDEILFG